MEENIKYSFKLILMECLKELNLEKIKNNEVILSYITMQLDDMCDNMSYTLLHCRDSKEEYENYKSKFIDLLKKELNKQFQIHISQDKIVIERTYVAYENGEYTYLNDYKSNTIQTQILQLVSLILNNKFYLKNFDINTYKLVYDKRTCRTYYYEIERKYNVDSDFISNRPILNIYDVKAIEEYNNNYEMISDKKYTSDRNYYIDEKNFIDNIKYSDELYNDKKQEFITGGDITQCNFKYFDNEFSFLLPTSRDVQVLDYINGDNNFIVLEDLENELEMLANCQEFYDEKPVVGITYVYSEEFLEKARDIKSCYEENIDEKIGREAAKKMGFKR